MGRIFVFYLLHPIEIHETTNVIYLMNEKMCYRDNYNIEMSQSQLGPTIMKF